MKRNILCAWLLAPTMMLATTTAWTAETVPRAPNGYVAKNESLRNFFIAMSPQLQKPVIVSKQAARKQISGDFDFSSPQMLLENISQELGLIWYHDGQAIYVYDVSEIRNAVISLRTMSLGAFNEFLRRAGLYDKRFPLRGDSSNGTFYISGPPIYVDLVTSTASLIDKQNDGIELGQQKIGVVRLNNTFVNDRVYALRDQQIVIPGMATVIEKLLHNESKPLQLGSMDNASANPTSAGEDFPTMPSFSSDSEGTSSTYTPKMGLATALQQQPAAAGDIKVIAYPDTNSLLIKGTTEQVRFIEQLTTALDVAKRHVELSLWIIDLNKDDLEQLGITWSGGANFGSSLGVTLNQTASISTLDGNRFIASIKALEQKNQATVVSRPVVLTQENVPAIFDNNRTFYARLIGERNSSLEHVTYGTLVSVLPRFSADGQIEMSLNIEDGSEAKSSDSSTQLAGALPEVGRTHISTVARVPQNKSLLIGGYTRDVSTEDSMKVPLLGDLPLVGGLFRYSSKNKSNTVRVFLIQPREITEPLPMDASEFTSSLAKQGGIDLDRAPLQKWVRSYLARDVREFSHGN